MLTQRFIQSVRNVPGVILRVLRAVLLRIALRVAHVASKLLLHLQGSGSSAPPTPPRSVEYEPSEGCASCSTVAGTSLGPVSLTIVESLEAQRDSPSHIPPPTLPSAVSDTQDIPLPTRHAATTITTHVINAIPIAPEQYQRYLLREPIKEKTNEHTISPGKIDYSETAPDMWKRIVHPEGARYFFNPRKQVLTDLDVMKQNLDEIDQCIGFLREKENRVVSVPPQAGLSQLVIQLYEEDEKKRWFYYFVNHETRVVFWVDEFETTNLPVFYDLQGVTAVSHIGYAIESQYWLHCEQYPDCTSVSQDYVTQFSGVIAHACADCSTSEAPLSTLSETQLARFLALVPYLQSRVGATDEYALWVIARAMGTFARARFYNFYGQPGARLEADLSVYTKEEDTGGSSLLFAPLDIFLFHTPSAHIKKLNGIWVDNIINYRRWEAFMGSLSAEWSGFTIYSTVMLAVDISFLAVPSVNNGDVDLQTATIVALYLSLLNVIGSLLSSILLTRQRRFQEESAGEAAVFMTSMTRWGGFKILSVIYSLPFALLIWGMIFFLLALFCIIFESSDRVTLGVVGSCAILIASLTSLCVWWGQDYSGWWDRISFPCRGQGIRFHRDQEM